MILEFVSNKISKGEENVMIWPWSLLEQITDGKPMRHLEAA